MKKKLSIFALTILCNLLPAEEYNTYNPVPVKLEQRPRSYIKQRIAKIIDGKDDSFCYILYHHRQNAQNLSFVSFLNDANSTANTYGFKEIKFAPMEKFIFFSHIKRIRNKKWILKTRFASFDWYCDWVHLRHRKFITNQIFIWNQDSANNQAVRFIDDRGGTKQWGPNKIAKLLDGKDLTFAFVASNTTKKTITIPDLLTQNSKIKIKFPDGKIFTYFDKSKGLNTLRLKPGESKYIKFDIYKLLDKTNEFSPDSFNYGMSELIWEVTMPDKSIVTNSFYLLKTEKPLPEIAKTKGYLMDVNKPLK